MSFSFNVESEINNVTISFRYEFDVRKCMFSAGNITEKLRVSQFDCRGETVVDLYAGEIISFFFYYCFYLKHQNLINGTNLI